MTDQELETERVHIYETRIAILCGDSKPTQEQVAIADKESRQTVKILMDQLSQEQSRTT